MAFTLTSVTSVFIAATISLVGIHKSTRTSRPSINAILGNAVDNAGPVTHKKARSSRNKGRNETVPQVMLDMMPGKKSPRVNPRVCVIGTTKETYPKLTDPLGELIAKSGFDLYTSNFGGNMDAIRKAFFNSPDKKGKSIFRPFKEWESDPDKKLPEFVDEAIERAPKHTQVDAVIALPGGPAVRDEIKDFISHKTPIIAFITDDDEVGEFGPINKMVKEVAPESVFLKDIEKISKFLDNIKASLPVQSAAGVRSVLLGVLSIIASAWHCQP